MGKSGSTRNPCVNRPFLVPSIYTPLIKLPDNVMDFLLMPLSKRIVALHKILFFHRMVKVHLSQTTEHAVAIDLLL